MTQSWLILVQVEDPFDRMDNCARSIQDISLPIICDTFSAAFEALLLPPDWNKLASLRHLLFCWPLGTPRPGIHVRHFPVADPGVWRSKTEIRAERRGKEQVKVPKKDRRADKTAAGKLKEPRSSTNSSDNLSPGLVPMLEGETGSFLLRESGDVQEPSHPQVLDVGGLMTPMGDTSQGEGSSNQTGGLTIMQALGLGSQDITNPDVGVSGSVEGQGAVPQTRRVKVNKTSKKMGPEQWGLSAVQYAQSQHLQPSPDCRDTGVYFYTIFGCKLQTVHYGNSCSLFKCTGHFNYYMSAISLQDLSKFCFKSGTLGASFDNEPGEARALPGSKKQTKSEGSWKSRSTGASPGNQECVRSSGVQR